MTIKEKRSEKVILQFRKAQKLFWWGALILVFDLVFWVSFVESTMPHPSWTRDIGVVIFAVGCCFFIIAAIFYINAKMHE